MKDTTYPGADMSQDRRRFGGIIMPSFNKLVHHSTETQGWPGYPTFAPNLTIDPFKKQVRQHMPLNMSASTLKNAGDLRTNRICCQIEWVMYCDPARKSSDHHISKLQDDEYRFMARVVAWFHKEWGIPLTALTFVSYPKSYGTRAAQRLSADEYRRYKGNLGHQHVPGNDHGDPGNINMPLIIKYAKDIVRPEPPKPPKPPTPPPPMKGEGTRRVRVMKDGVVKPGFGKDFPGDWQAGYHPGEDWNVPGKQGQVLYAPVHGTVVETSNSTSDPLSWGAAYGCGIIIQDPTGDRTLVGHMKGGSLKKTGTYVHAGEEIGVEGGTGRVTGDHAHVERRHAPFKYADHEKPLYDAARPGSEIIYVSDLRPGMTGSSSIYWLQRVINEVSFPDGRNLRITGDWTPGLKDEIIKYQRMMGHAKDGIIDAWQTRDLVKRAGGQLAKILEVK